MKVTLVGTVLTVVTDIAKEVADKGIAALVARDDKKNELYKVAQSKDGKGSITTFGMTTNAEVDGKLAYIEVLPADTTRETVFKQYGEALLAAATYTKVIAEQAQSKEDTISALFE